MKRWRSAVLFFQSCDLSVVFIDDLLFPHKLLICPPCIVLTGRMHDDFSLIQQSHEFNLPYFAVADDVSCRSSKIERRYMI